MKLSLMNEDMTTTQREALPKPKQQLLKELLLLEDKYDGKHVVCDYYQLGRMHGKQFSQEAKTLISKDIPVEIDHFVSVNWHWDSAGKLYIINEAKTAEFAKRLQAHKETLQERDETEQAAGKALTGALKSVKAASKPSAAPAKAAVKKVYAVLKEWHVVGREGILDENNIIHEGTLEECTDFVTANKPQDTKEELKAKFIQTCEDNAITKKQLQEVAKKNSLPEEEYIALNATELKEFVADALCEVPNALAAYTK